MFFNAPSESHPLQCEETCVSWPHMEPSSGPPGRGGEVGLEKHSTRKNFLINFGSSLLNTVFVAGDHECDNSSIPSGFDVRQSRLRRCTTTKRLRRLPTGRQAVDSTTSQAAIPRYSL